MLYKYEFVKHQKMRELSFHIIYFIRKIRTVKKTKAFVPKLFFHPDFINNNGDIAPRGTVNKTIQKNFKAFFDDFKKLEPNSKNEFYQLVLFSKDIHLYFEDINIHDVINLRNENIKRIVKTDSFKNLMDSLWKYLKSPNAWEIDIHYDEFYDKLPESKMCPFCGLNKISNQELFKSDYDHIAYKADYPLSSINLKNLAPSCSFCNRNFKGAKDVFFNDLNQRKVFMYPYVLNQNFEMQNIEIDLTGSIIPNTSSVNMKGKWVVNITPINNFTEAWNTIYLIKKRYSLSVNHDKWLYEMTFDMKQNNLKVSNIGELKTYLSKHKEKYNPKNRLDLEYHLKYSYFKYLEVSANMVLFNQINQMCA